MSTDRWYFYVTAALLFLTVLVPIATTLSIGPECTNRKLTPKHRLLILGQHNAFRSEVSLGKTPKKEGGFAPSAANMYKLQWSCELESTAQKWADKCVFEHSPRADRPGTGENLFWSFGIGRSLGIDSILPIAAPSWWREYVDFGPVSDGDNRLTMKEIKKGIGHWTQMAWGSTTHLGCGFGNCSNTEMNYAYVVCQYRNAGNYMGKPIYDLGKPCSQDGDCTTLIGSRCLADEGLCTIA